jgi:hypothetical protein
MTAAGHLLRADPTSYLSVFPLFMPFLGTDLVIGRVYLRHPDIPRD